MRIFLPACSLALLAGCATTPAPRSLDTAGLTAVRNQSVAVTSRPRPGFAVLKAGNMMFGALGGLAGVDEGNKIATANGLPNPADAIAQELVIALRDTQGAQSAAPVAVETNDVERIAAQAKGKARFVLDVETRMWHVTYFPTDWTHYQVPYAAVARLIDADTARVLAEASCKVEPGTNAGAPTYDELLAGGAARLKATIAASVATCAAQFKRDMFAMREAAASAVAAAASAPAPAAETVAWTGTMACGARNDSGPNAAAYEAKFSVDVQGPSVRAHRKTADVEETLAGEVRGDQLELRGTGNRVADPARSWGLGVSGAFAPGATSYVGKGNMVVGGRPIRACELRMTRA
ncbi:hypothetical protein NX786_03335 [Telluria mixta]|uniref:Lipoprotein n=1 Tax=Telluria mixta TaxID=34071 RepID=A0ABT2BTD3_9BURK|nr:hypothetical protein [Telluria mixta]MCS0628363.1 hypothetical protein [Telluria mixta]WEM93529.1 hypothetical protein P0M04_18660 [Telluria mixta]